MTQEDKELLLKDLCARLPYGTKAQDYDDEPLFTIVGYECLYFCDDNGWEYKVDEIKPYLFPLSSMTEEQKSYINGRWGVNEHFEFEIDPLWGEYFVDVRDAVDFINWCYENHFDINGLIPKGIISNEDYLKSFYEDGRGSLFEDIVRVAETIATTLVERLKESKV